MVAVAWLRPDWNRQEIPDWKPVLALADASLGKGDLSEARHLYLQVDRIASWRQDWEGLVSAACGINRLDGVPGPYSKAFSILLRAGMAADHRQSRQGIATVAEAFEVLVSSKTATALLPRIQPNWPNMTNYSDSVQLLEGCRARAPVLDDVIYGTVESHEPRGITGYDLRQNPGGCRYLLCILEKIKK
jgi:hypothetical protein